MSEEEFLEDVSGFPTEEEKNDNDRQICTTALARADLLKSLTLSPGWKILSNAIAAEVISFLEQLAIEKDMEKVLRVQCVIAALRFLPKFIDSVFLESEKAHQVLAQLTEI